MNKVPPISIVEAEKLSSQYECSMQNALDQEKVKVKIELGKKTNKLKNTTVASI